MYLHANAKLGLAGRLALVRAIEEGLSLKAAAAAFSVSPATAHRWWHRWLDGGRAARARCWTARAVRAARRGCSLPSCRSGSATAAARPAGVRVWSPARPASRTRPSGRCCAGTASRGGRRAVKEPANSYEWPCPGDLLHMDTSRYARFLHARPRGHRRPLAGAARPKQDRHTVGYDFAHAIVDDHSRLAYVELHDDEKAATVTGFVERALAFFAEHGIAAKRLMTDNAFSYVHNRSLRELLARRGIRHLTHPALPASHQRQGGALPPDDGARMGLRARLPLTSTPQRRPATLAQQLQPATATQLNRRPAPDQPRSQRPWVGQLERGAAG